MVERRFPTSTGGVLRSSCSITRQSAPSRKKKSSTCARTSGEKKKKKTLVEIPIMVFVW